MLVPEDILSDLQSADNARCSLYGQPLTTSSHAQALVAWRCKMLLIRTSLLSALNGICHELEAPTNTPHHVETSVMAGLERSNSQHGRQHISLQNSDSPIQPLMTHMISDIKRRPSSKHVPGNLCRNRISQLRMNGGTQIKTQAH